MFRLTKKGIASTYRLIDGSTGEELSQLKSNWSYDSGSIAISGVTLTFARAEPEHTDLVLRRDGVALATARHLAGGGGWHTELDGEAATIELREHRKRFEAILDGESAGSIALEGFAGRRIIVDMATAVDLEVQLFCGWLAVKSWNQQANTRAVK